MYHLVQSKNGFSDLVTLWLC